MSVRWSTWALCSSELEQYVEARSHLEQAARLDPKQDDALYILGTIERATGNPDKAIERFALDAGPEARLLALPARPVPLAVRARSRARGQSKSSKPASPSSPTRPTCTTTWAICTTKRVSWTRRRRASSRLCPSTRTTPRCTATWPIHCRNVATWIAPSIAHEKALQLHPGLEAAQNNLLFALNYHPDKSAQEIFAAYREYDERVGLPLRGTWREHANSRDPDQATEGGLCLARLSPALGSPFPGAAAGAPRQALWSRCSPMQSCRWKTPRRRAIAAYVDHWMATVGLSDDALAERIRADGIDILVDLAGHTGKESTGRLCAQACAGVDVVAGVRLHDGPERHRLLADR